MKKHLFILGTRPEAIKLAPLITLMKQDTSFDVKVCVTGQHQLMLEQVLSFFKIVPDYDLRLMKPNQTLGELTANALIGITRVLEEVVPENVFVQGDTTTALTGAMASFYHKVHISHIEAGLRSHDKFSPFPEETNRVLIARMANMHFAPTSLAMKNLLNEGIAPEKIKNVGNTVIDALLLGLEVVKKNEYIYASYFPFVDPQKKIVLVTGHRRENFGEPFENICYAIKEIADMAPNVQIVYPVHLNPNVQQIVKRILNGHDNIFLIPPLEYPHLLWLLNRSHIVLTDSGGIQEEAPSLGKPVLVMREVTERTEGIDAGTAKLVGTSRATIVNETINLLQSKVNYDQMSKAVNPYGDGTTSKKITNFFK